MPKPHTPFQWAAQCDAGGRRRPAAQAARGDQRRPVARPQRRHALPRRRAVAGRGTALARRPPGRRGDRGGLARRRPLRRLVGALLLRALDALRRRRARRRRHRLVHHPRARRRRGAALGPPRLRAWTSSGSGTTGRTRSASSSRTTAAGRRASTAACAPTWAPTSRSARPAARCCRSSRADRPLMARRVPSGPPPPPVVQRLRVHYAKRGRLRFSSHRDFARAFERALRRADMPMGYSAGFIAAPEDQLRRRGADRRGQRGRVPRDRPGPRVRPGGRSASRWTRRCPTAWTSSRSSRPARARSPSGCRPRTGAWSCPASTADGRSTAAVDALLARAELSVERLTKDGRRTIDVRPAIVLAEVATAADGRAILDLVVRQVTPPYDPTTSSPRCGSSPVSPSPHRRSRCAWRRDRSTRRDGQRPAGRRPRDRSDCAVARPPRPGGELKPSAADR